VYQTAVAGTRRTGVENLAEDADDVFSVVSYIMKIMFQHRCFYPKETTIVMNCDAVAMNVD